MIRQKAHILIVDDLESNRRLVQQVLQREGYRVSSAVDGVEALQRIAEERPDLVLLDVSMPRMDGLTVLHTLRARHETELLPVILVTAQSENVDKVRGLDAGASDFLPKPWEVSELLARVRAQLRVRFLTRELERAEEVLFMLARVVEARDAYTMEHTERVAQYSLAIGQTLGLSDWELDALRKGAMLHDIGKIGIPDTILHKTGPLNNDEWRRMKQHPAIGIDITKSLQSLGEALRIIRNHHERWDGKGYPDGLVGERIPLLARITAIADAFDAMTTDRPYHKGKSFVEALQTLAQGAGVQWDPKLVEIAMGVLPRLYR
jgi:putative two-component system response regulator